MKERPIPFSAPMVPPVLADTKTQTRRAWRDQPPPGVRVAYVPSETRCPYGQPGDRLWVREAWRTVSEADALPPRELTPAHRIWYEASKPHQPGYGKLRPGMFMPRWASRITLEVTGVRVERAQDISVADALAEGIVPTRGGYGLADGSHFHTTDPRISYWSLLDAINGSGFVELNPWLWVVVFRRLP